MIVDHQDVRGVDLVEAGQLADRLAAVVHVGQGLDQDHLFPVKGRETAAQNIQRRTPALHPAIPQAGVGLGAPQINAVAGRKAVHHLEADIVPVPGIGRAWIAQAHDHAQSCH